MKGGVCVLQNAHWICDPLGERDICPVFCCDFTTDKVIAKATLYASSRGVYEAFIGETRLGEQVMTPGWTNCSKENSISRGGAGVARGVATATAAGGG